MTDISIKRPCVKFGNWLSWIEKERYFNFDAATEKYRYYMTKDDAVDVESKARLIYKGEYEVNRKVFALTLQF